MSQEQKYYVRREECWGGTYVWSVADRSTRVRASKYFKAEAPARAMCARMSADWERYQRAMWARPQDRNAKEA